MAQTPQPKITRQPSLDSDSDQAPVSTPTPTQALPVHGPPALPSVKRHRGWRIALITIASVVAGIVIVIGIITLGVRSMQTDQQNEMYEIVHSKEADKAFRKDLLNMDPLAFTDKGVIQSYEIGDDTISHNPMGGINLALYINGDEDLYESVTLNRRNGEGPLEVGGSSTSIKLYDLVGLNNQRYGVTAPAYPDDAVKEYAEQLKKLNESGNEPTGGKSERNGDGDE